MLVTHWRQVILVSITPKMSSVREYYHDVTDMKYQDFKRDTTRASITTELTTSSTVMRFASSLDQVANWKPLSL